MHSRLVLAAVAALSIGAGSAFAQAGHHGHGSHGALHTSAAGATDGAAATFSEGTVRRVDAANGKLTIAHGPLDNLGMPPMTMVFAVSGETSLDGIAVGDRIRFVAEKSDDAFVVTTLKPVQ